VFYKAKLRLIDTEGQRTVAEGFCAYIPEKTAEAPSREELIDSDAELLKAELQVAAEYCVDEFRAKALGL
jgi:hypothetical protein